jgi:hypothetical protein
MPNEIQRNVLLRAKLVFKVLFRDMQFNSLRHKLISVYFVNSVVCYYIKANAAKFPIINEHYYIEIYLLCALLHISLKQDHH